jgi:cytochrome c-type biogenesis protein CcmH/NrfG
MIKVAEKCLELDAENQKGLFYLGRALLMTGELSKSKEVLA